MVKPGPGMILHWRETNIFLFKIILGTQCVFSGEGATRLHKCSGRRSGSFLVGYITGYQRIAWPMLQQIPSTDEFAISLYSLMPTEL